MAINVRKEELIKLMVDTIEDNYGIKAVDKVDLESLADSCINRLYDQLDNTIHLALEQATNKS